MKRPFPLFAAALLAAMLAVSSAHAAAASAAALTLPRSVAFAVEATRSPSWNSARSTVTVPVPPPVETTSPDLVIARLPRSDRSETVSRSHGVSNDAPDSTTSVPVVLSAGGTATEPPRKSSVAGKAGRESVPELWMYDVWPGLPVNPNDRGSRTNVALSVDQLARELQSPHVASGAFQ